MSSFTRPLQGTFASNGLHFTLAESFEYYTDIKPPCDRPEGAATKGGDRWTIHVPAGLETDFASVPRLLWSIAPPVGLHSKAAVLHDYLYAENLGSRKWADRVFLEAMKVSGVRWTRRRLYYRMVRLFGWIAWRGHARGKKKETSDAG